MTAIPGNVNWNGILRKTFEKVEVARGPFSSLYGGNAHGGVINILTEIPEKREITLKGGAGSDSFVRPRVVWGQGDQSPGHFCQLRLSGQQWLSTRSYHILAHHPRRRDRRHRGSADH